MGEPDEATKTASAQTDGTNVLGRRGVVVGLTVAGVAVGAGVVLGDAAPSDQTSRTAPRLGSLVPGTILPGTEAKVVTVFPITFGAIPVVLELPSGERFQLDVLARDPNGPHGVGNTDRYSVYVSNRGSGGTSTHEAQGLAAMALARSLASEGTSLSDLMTLQDRHSAHPNGTFAVPLYS